MPAAPMPPNEPARVAALRALNILDTAPDAVYDALTDLARSIFGTPMASLSFIDAERQWLKSVQGMDTCQTSRDVSFCAHTILQPDRVTVVPDATRDSRFADNPLVTGAPGIRFYAGAPLKDRQGHVLGALCVVDDRPRTVGPDLLRKLEQIAAGASAALHLHGCVQELSRLALTDPLTCLANRAAFDRHLEEACADGKGGVTLLMFDLDGFKGINDLLGHPGGDRALREVADRLRLVARTGDLVARFGGDEFAMLLAGPVSAKGAMALAARVHATLADTFRIDGQVVPLRTSIGVATAPRDATAPRALLAAADGALYEAKRAGRGVTRLAGPPPGSEPRPAALGAVGRLTLQGLLREALLSPGDRPFRLHFQPIVDIRSGRVASLEALIRWTLADGRSLPPGEFVPLAEETGLVTHLDRWVLERACAVAAGWSGRWQVSVNMSPASVALLDVAALVDDVLGRTGLPADRLRLEITETVPVSDPVRMAAAIRGLRARGVTVAVDDLGSGYASLAHLRRYPFDASKVDRSLVAGLGTDREAAAMLRALVQLTEALKLPAVVEGVETREQFRLLEEIGISRMQGFLFGRPVSEERVEESVREAEGRVRRLVAERATGRAGGAIPAPPRVRVAEPGTATALEAALALDRPGHRAEPAAAPA